RKSVLPRLTQVTMAAIYQWAGWTAKRLRASSLIQAKKSEPSQRRGAHSGFLGGVGEAMGEISTPPPGVQSLTRKWGAAQVCAARAANRPRRSPEPSRSARS